MIPRGNPTVVALFVASAIVCSMTICCLQVQGEGGGFLSWASRFVTWWVQSFGNQFSRPTDVYRRVVCVSFPVLGALVGHFLLRRRYSLAVLLALCAIPLLGEFFFLYGHVVWGTTVHCVALCLFVIFFVRTRETTDDRELVLRPLTLSEILTLCFILLVTAGYRYYLLNLIPSAWDTELCDFRYTALTTFSKILEIETFQPRPTSAGFSWTLTFWLLGNLDEPDNYYLYARLVSAAISLFKTTLLYAAVRYISGPTPALFSAAVLAFTPPENWWARQPGAHHLPGLMAVVIIFLTARAYRNRSWVDFCVAAIASALARWMYASGLFLVFIPLTFFLLVAAANWRVWRPHWLKIFVLLLGPLIWAAWSSVAYFFCYGELTYIPPLSVPASERSSGGVFGLIARIFSGTLPELLRTIFAQQVNPTHWTVSLTLAPARSTSSLTIILGIVGLARAISGRGGAMSILLLTSVVWAAIPGLATSIADRRIGAVFVVLIMFAAHELGNLLKAFRAADSGRLGQTSICLLTVVVGVYQSWIALGLHFRDEPRLPIQVVEGRLIRPLLEPGTLTVYIGGGRDCDSFMSVLQTLKVHKCSIGWAQPRGSPYGVEQIIADPKIDLDWFNERAPELASCYRESGNSWKKVRFLFNSRSNWESLTAKLEQVYPDGVLSSFKPPAGSYSDFLLYSYTASLKHSSL